MKQENWERIQELFLSAADLPAEEQQRLLDAVCAGDAALRREVESLLASDRKRCEAVARAVEGEAAALLNSQTLVGQWLGPYRVVREIGRGGMGAVYLATRDDPYRKQVAIKVVKRGMDTEDMLRRFRAERQILANLEHPYIARLIDGGSTGAGQYSNHRERNA
jgi:serine/threonine protein kinase